MILKLSARFLLRRARRSTSLASYSTAALCEEIPEGFRTLETDPSKHGLDHEGKFYTIDQATCDTVFKEGGFSRHFREQVEILGEMALMVRRPALEVIHYLKNADYSLPPIRYVLYSQNLGAGMTLSLAHIIHYAWLNKWLIVHCTKPFSWVRKPLKQYMGLSTYNPSRLDQNKEAVDWLLHFKLQNAHLLNEIKLSKSYTWSKRETSEQGEPLTSIVDHGLDRQPHATDCVSAVLKEVKGQSGPNSFRTLFVVDGVNALFGDTKQRRPDGTKIEIEDLSLLRGFKKLLTNDWSNAAIVTSADRFADCTLPLSVVKPPKIIWPDRNPHAIEPKDLTVPITRKQKQYPRELLGSKCFSILDPFIPVEVEKYSMKEFNSCYDYYTHQNFIQSEQARSPEGREELRFLSGRIPADLMRYCSAL